MGGTEVPGPEPEWESAPSYGGAQRHNPGFQKSMWEFAAPSFRLVAGLRPPLEALAARLRLRLERGWEDLGEVDVAIVRIEGIHFALTWLHGAVIPRTFVWVDRSVQDVDTALDTLLRVLGIDRRALAFQGSIEEGFEEFDGPPG
ncbi:hypothetical protein ACFWXK_22610 [Streptomyces sp. NPDC059070]|uniref:hypothetical protein n=1 Tax=Streptomyces sp. NPDC059070 TaxID=3346713 RepID=UPI00367B60D6